MPVMINLRCQRCSRLAVRLGLFALLLQTLIPFSQAVPVAFKATSGAGSQSGFLLHCLTMAGSGKPGPDNNGRLLPVKPGSCPVCQTFAIGKTQLPYVFRQLLSQPVIIGWHIVKTAFPPVYRRTLIAFYARAPPAVS
jgi:hypothetical protein